MNSDYPVIVKTYNLTLWYIKKLNTLPKNHRYTLGEKIQNTLLNFLLILSDAIYSKDKKLLLQNANKEIEKLRFLTRLLKDLRILSTDNFHFVTSAIKIGSGALASPFSLLKIKYHFWFLVRLKPHFQVVIRLIMLYFFNFIGKVKVIYLVLGRARVPLPINGCVALASLKTETNGSVASASPKLKK